MKFIISGKNIDVTDALRDKVESKLNKLEKFFNAGTEVHATMSVEKTRHILEITIHFNGTVLRVEVANDDMYACIDKAMDKLEAQIRRNKTRLEKKLREGAFRDAYTFDSKDQEEHNFNIVRSKKFAIKPMTVEEAVLQMNLIGHEFFMFSNADTKEVNVVYKRKNGNYGLIEPEF